MGSLVLALAALVLATGAAHAADGPTVFVDSIPASPIAEDGASLFGPDVESAVLAYGLTTPTPPIPIVPETWMIVNTLELSDVRVAYTGAALVDPSEGVSHLTTVRWGLFSLVRPHERWTLVAGAMPALTTDFGGAISSRDLTVQALVLADYEASDAVHVGFGGAYTYFLGGPLLVPMVTMHGDWDRGRLRVDLPQRLEGWFLPVPALGLGGVAEVKGGFYHQTPVLPGTPRDVYTKYSVAAAGPAVEVVLREKIRLEVHGGRTLLRRNTISLSARDDLGEVDLAQSWTFGAQVGLVLGADED